MLQYQELSDRIVPALCRVHRLQGPGLLENVYEQALSVELSHLGIPHVCQQAYPVYYRKKKVGEYFADLVVDNKIILELKSVTKLNYSMEAQLLNYLGISGLRVGYLVNFRNVSLQRKRFFV
ncbi:MAG: GxxExxY protein [Spirochaetales bacterium]|nr:GxxExxY protein [Spirochaetales bacterium]